MPPTRYNLIAGTSVERLAALSDGVFAVALTLLVLDLKVPAPDTADLGAALIALAPKFLTWIVSFLTLGIFWVGQQTQLNHLAKAGRSLDWIHLLFLAAVSVLPFTTSLMGEFIHDRLALGLYWGNIAVLGASLYASWCHARAKNLLRPDIAPGVVRAIERRIVVAQSFYAAGAALCAIHPYWSIGFILAVQLNYAIAPRLRLWGRS